MSWNGKFGITIDVTMHNEGDYLFKTFKSIAANIAYVKKLHRNLKFQINIGLDRPDGYTVQTLERHRHILDDGDNDFHLYELDFGDPALSRNFLIDKSDGKYIVMLDGDYLTSENYLGDAYTMAEKNKTPAVYSCAFMLNFTSGNNCWGQPGFKILSSNDPLFLPTNLYTCNPYPLQLFANAEIFKSHKYTANGDLYKYEDMNFNLNLLADGFIFYVVPDTVFYYRRKSHAGVQYMHESNDKLLVAPTKYYAPDYFGSLDYVDSRDINRSNYVSMPIVESLTIDKEKRHLAKKAVRRYASATKRLIGDGHGYRFIQFSYGAVRQLFLPIKKLLTDNYINRRVRPYVSRAIQELCRNDDVQTRLSDEEKFEQLGRQKSILYSKNINRWANSGFSPRCMELTAKANQIESHIAFDRNYIIYERIENTCQPNRIDDAYFNLCNIAGRNGITDILLLCRITRGGADKAMLDLVRTMCANGRKVLVITTEIGIKNTWSYKFREIDGCTYIERDHYLADLSDDKFEEMIVRVIQNWPGIKTLTIMNSMPGSEMVLRYHEVLRKYVKIIMHGWMYEVLDTQLQLVPFMADEIYNYIDCLVTDGKAYPKTLIDKNGLKADKVRPVYLMINDKIKPVVGHKVTKRILYAGRIARQKRVDLLLSEADKLAKLGIKIDFYGAIDRQDPEWYVQTKFLETVEKYDNLRYCGEFNDFARLPLDKYDALILPTRYEGMPNIVLEALKANLIVIAGKCVSIPSVVKDYKNGLLVEDNGNSKAYLKAIKDFYANGNKFLSGEERLKFNEDVLAKHSPENYKKSISEIYGFN